MPTDHDEPSVELLEYLGEVGTELQEIADDLAKLPDLDELLAGAVTSLRLTARFLATYTLES